MTNCSKILYVLCFVLACLLQTSGKLYAQDIPVQQNLSVEEDTLRVNLPDSVVKAQPVSINLTKWRPNPKKAMWMALVIPGGGQIYNRKYWKLPLIYGGFVGCAYALSWNNQMYKDYSQAYLDIMDDDPNTKSYEDFLPYGTTITDSNLSKMQTILQKKKDYYRRYRDLSMFCFIGVYLLSVVDAYVDAELSEFDINNELSLKVEPAIINNTAPHQELSFARGNSYGLQCSIKF